MVSRQLPPTFYFSLRSPYSWLAMHDLRTQHPNLFEQLLLIPFWEPDEAYQASLTSNDEIFLYTPMSRQKHLYILNDVKRLAALRGLTPSWPVDRNPVWEVPHLAWIAADTLGQGRAFAEHITLARWQRGMNICDPEVIGQLGEELGLDARPLRDAVQNADIRCTGLTHLQACIQDGVFGVPFFRAGREKFWGVDRLPHFIAALDGARTKHDTPHTPLPLNQPHRALLDHAGGCG